MLFNKSISFIIINELNINFFLFIFAQLTLNLICNKFFLIGFMCVRDFFGY